MMKKDFPKYILILTFSLIIQISAQPQNVKIIFLKECIDSALVNHPSLKAFKKVQESKAANTKSLKNQLLPELEFTTQSQYNIYKGYSYGTLDSRFRFVWDMGKWTGELQKAGITEEKIAQFQSQKNRLDLIYRVHVAYYNLINDLETLRIAKNSESYLEHLLAVNKKLYSIGQIKQLDYFSTQSELSLALENVLAAESEIESSKMRLSKFTGFNLSLTDSLEVPKEHELLRNLSIDSLLSEAHRFNPALKILDKQIELEKIRANLIKNNRMPKIYLGGGYVFDNDPTSDGNYGAISGGLLIPIFDWGARSYQVQSVQLKAESIKSVKQTLLRELKTELELLTNRIANIKKLLLLKDNSIKQAKKTYELTLINYKTGISTNTEVLLAQKAYMESKVSKEKVIFTLYKIESQIENLIGKPEVRQ
jgi:outer membrane protein TolC